MISCWRTGRRAGGGLVAIAVSAAQAACAAEYPQTTFRPVTEYGEALNRVFANTFWWTMAILLVVLVLVVYVVVRFRERPGQAPPRQIHGSTKLELLWTTLPAIIVVFIAVPTVQTIFETQRRPPPEALTVEVIGHQWWWEFRYPEQGVITANQIVVPVGREIHLRMTSADVIHSFWVPRIGGKRDVNPTPRGAEGEQQTANHLLFTLREPGLYSGQCAEFCGASHAIMAMTLLAVEPSEFEAWLGSMRDRPALPPGQPPEPAQPGAVAGQPAPDTTRAGAAAGAAGDRVPRAVAQADTARGGAQAPAGAASMEEQGRQIFLSRSCIACHAIANTTARGLLGPNLTRFGSRPTIGAGALPNTVENLERWITNPRAVKAGTMMPGTQAGAPPPGNPAGEPFPATGLSADEVRAVAAYLFSLK